MRPPLFLILCLLATRVGCLGWLKHWDQWEGEQHTLQEDYEEEYAETLKESKEPSKVVEEKKENAEVIKMVEGCMESCISLYLLTLLINKDKYYQVNPRAGCQLGCETQMSALKYLQVKYPNTWLLGAAVGTCWNGCFENLEKASQHSCIVACDTMMKMQKKKIDNEKFTEEEDSEKELSKNIPAREEQDLDLANKPDTNLENVRTWPDLQLLRQMFKEMTSGDTSEDKLRMSKVGDLWQMKWPTYFPRTAAMSSEDSTPGLYDQVAASFEHMKDNVKRTIETPEVKENIFFILLGLTGFMLMSSIFNSMLCQKENTTLEDHYFLPPAKALPVKLPTYEECSKADKQLVVGLTQQEEVCKVNLSIPVVASPPPYMKMEEAEVDKVETV